MATPRDERRERRFVLSQAASALSAPMPGWRRGAIGAGAAVAAVSLTVAAGLGIFSGHQASAEPVATRPPAASAPSPSSQPSPQPSVSTAPAWQRGDLLLVDATTGTRYVYRSGRLRPVRNETSAFLILGTARPATVSIPHATIVAAAIGSPIGISGIPARTPAASALMSAGWVACTGPVSAGVPAVRIVAPAAGSFGAKGFAGYGTGLSGGAGLGNGAVVVTTGGVDYLIWNRQRDAIGDPSAVFSAWKWGDVVPVPVVAGVLDALPAGPPVTVKTAPPARRDLAVSATLCVEMDPAGTAVHTVGWATVGAGVGPAHLVLAAGHGVLIRTSGRLYLVTDRGTAYPIANTAARDALGYRSSATVSVPASVVALIPKGPTLSRHVVADG